MHRKQCCFYSDTSRFDPSSSPSAYQSSPPNVALMNAIYLLGSFFAQVSGWENQLFEETQHEVARSLHSAEPPADMVQALCLLAQYCFFTARDIEGNRHLSAAKRIAIDIGLHQVSPLATFPFGPEYFDTASLNWAERSAIFWQLYMVNNFWSPNNDCCVASFTLTLPCRHISTPLPVEDGAAFVRLILSILTYLIVRLSFRKQLLQTVLSTGYTRPTNSILRICQSRPSRRSHRQFLIARYASIVRFQDIPLLSLIPNLQNIILT